VPFGYELVATFLLSGGRQDEVLGLEVSDVDFKRDTLTFRPNQWRRLKTEKSHRTVPLWPQLKQILRAYVMGKDEPTGRLLFPSNRGSGERMLTDVRKLLDRVADRAGTLYVIDAGHKRKAEEGEIRTKVFRHSYTSARVQTLDHGQPVSLWTVARELGHSSTSMIERVYAHLAGSRHRAEQVEFRVQQHRKILRGRLELVA
jgi:integrase